MVSWYGCGPGESYPDRKLSTPLGVWESTVDGLHFPFVPPSENGGRDDVRWLRFTHRDGRRLTVRTERPLHFDAHHYTVEDCQQAAHDHELPHRPETWLHLDAVHGPIGSDMAWSTVMSEKYAIEGGDVSFAFEIVME